MVDTERGEGSVFHFTVRFGVAAPSTVGFPISDTKSLQGLDILVVDDNGASRRILNEILLGWKMKPALADGGKMAFEILRGRTATGNPFPLILWDAQVPVDDLTLSGQNGQDAALAGPRIMMGSSADLKSLPGNLRHQGNYVVKPVTRTNLLKALLKALSEESHPIMAARNPAPPANSHSLRILLVEDNAINRKVALRLLEKQGHSVAVAVDGAEALVAFDREAFDAILMDVQMPVMNGYDATRAIRDREQETGRHTFIIALTAHAMKGDRELCLKAGMDDYLSKPVQVKELISMLERHAPNGRSFLPERWFEVRLERV